MNRLFYLRVDEGQSWADVLTVTPMSSKFQKFATQICCHGMKCYKLQVSHTVLSSALQSSFIEFCVTTIKAQAFRGLISYATREKIT
jgi:hypothetical protein